MMPPVKPALFERRPAAPASGGGVADTLLEGEPESVPLGSATRVESVPVYDAVLVSVSNELSPAGTPVVFSASVSEMAEVPLGLGGNGVVTVVVAAAGGPV